MFAALRGQLPWEKVTIFQVDERVAPDGEPDRNLTSSRRASHLEELQTCWAMPVEARRPRAPAADDYAATLPECVRPASTSGSGRTGTPRLSSRRCRCSTSADRDVACTGEYQGHRRMTLTYPVLDRAREILWLVTGEDKVDALASARNGRPVDSRRSRRTPRRPRHRRRGCGRISAMSERRSIPSTRARRQCSPSTSAART